MLQIKRRVALSIILSMHQAIHKKKEKNTDKKYGMQMCYPRL